MKKYLKHRRLEPIFKLLMSHKRYLFFIFLVLSTFILFTDQFKAVLIVGSFAIISSVITMYKRIVRMPPVFEFVSLTTVLVTLLYGPIVGIFYTVIVNLASEIFSGYPDVMTLTYIPSRSIQVLFVWIFSDSMGIVALGIWSVIVFNLVQQPVFMFLTDTEQRLKAVYFIVLNIPINILLFRLLAEPLYTLLQRIVG